MTRRRRLRSGAGDSGTWIAMAARDAADRAARAGCDVITIAVVQRIALHMNRQGMAKPSVRYLAECLNLHTETVANHIAIAEVAGVFTVHRRPKAVNRYYFGVAAPVAALREAI